MTTGDRNTTRDPGTARDRSTARNRSTARDSAQRTIGLETAGLQALAAALDESFDRAVDLLHDVAGRVIVSGMGKSGHVGRKIAATLASTGTPAQFVHPGEASHGDLGMITPRDAIMALSWSGETEELRHLIAYASRFAIPLLALCAAPGSTLARTARVTLLLPQAEEACPNGLAPTTSTIMQLALGDAIAMALLERNGFTASRFRDFHPGGKLGAQLTTIARIMHTGAGLPIVRPQTPMPDVIALMSEKGFGCVAVTAEDGRLEGIITDGDLRRCLGPGLLSATADSIMTRSPRTITPDTLAGEALELIHRSRITSLLVVEDGRLVGLAHVHDFLQLGAA